MCSTIKLLGFNTWQRQTEYESFNDGYAVLRVTAVNKNSCQLSDGSHTMPGELAGRFVYATDDNTEFPATGDWVEAEVFANNTFAIIHNILPRHSLLKRKSPGKTIDFQLIAANVDTGLIVQAANNLSLNLFERYLVLLNNSGIKPVTLITKIDLLDSTELSQLQQRLQRLNCRSILLNNTDAKSFSTGVAGLFQPEQTYCLLGPSGAGKSTIINNLLEQQLQKTADVRGRDGKGRHTTVSRQLRRLDSGVILIDTPGMRELGNFEVASGIENTFSEFAEYAASCKFADCTHTHESGCAVKDAVAAGIIEPERYNNYLKLRKESAYYSMKYHDKQQKDKQLSRTLKHYNKHHRKH